MLMLIVLQLITLTSITGQQLYNHNSATYRNQTWLSTIDDGVPLRQLTIIGSHSSMSTGTWGDAFQTQASSLPVQLASGMRALDIRCRHYQDSFPIHERLVYLNTDLGGVLSIVQTFLASYPSETVLMHIVEEYNPSGNSGTFEDVFITYKNAFSNLIWTPTTQNPTLGMTRGKVVIIQNFPGAIHGLLYSSFTTIEHKSYSTNWDQYSRWQSIKNFISSTSDAKSSRISFWTGSVGSFPYFCASGKSSPQNGAPRLATGLTTPGFSSYYPDFPRVMCLWTLCTIVFEGINTLAMNYINANGIFYMGIVFIDFAGDVLISSAIAKNANMFGKCTVTKISQGCTACSTTGVCISCNDMLHYLLDTTTSTCIAASGYYLNASYIPELCSIAMPGCLDCTSATVCTICDTFLNYQLSLGQCDAADGYYLDFNFIPVKCNIQGCYLCSSATVCTNCSSATNFIMDINGDCICDSSAYFVFIPTGVCICQPGRFLSLNGSCEPIPLCPANNSGCITCVSSVCTICDTAAGFISSSPYCLCESGLYYDGIGCGACNVTQPACLECLSSTLCTQCVANFTLIQGRCVCQQQFYSFDSDTCLQCTVGCLSCTGTSSCTACNANASFLLINGLCQCQVGKYVDLITYGEVCVPCGAMPGCLNCNMNGCIACDSIFGFSLSGITCVCNFGYYINTMGVCTQCRMEGCLDCDIASMCAICDNTTYFLDSNGICKQLCGDGLLFNLQCDDGNLMNGDGCSSICTIQTDFTCSGGSSSTPSACSYSGSITLTLQSYTKVANQNKVQINFLLTPNIAIFDNIDYGTAIVPNFPVLSKDITYNKQTGQINFIFTYDNSLNTNNNMSVSFQPPSQNLQFYYTPKTKLSLPFTTDNNLALKPYTPQIYAMMPVLNVLIYILLVLSLLGFFFGLLSSKLIGVQMIMVVQISYIGLITIDKLQSLLYCLINLWPSNGYNKFSLPDKLNSTIPPRVSVIGYKTYFLANFNLNFILMLLPIIVGLIIFICSKIKSDKQLRIKSYNIFKEWGITALLFVQIHLIASLCLAVKYGMQQIYGIVIGAFGVLFIIVMSILFWRRPKNFGEYKSFFDHSSFKSNFYLLAILFRLIITFGIVGLNQSIIGITISLATVILEIIIIIVFRPYKTNLRPTGNLLVIAITLSIYLAYKNRIVDEVEWVTSYLPLFLIVLLIICVVVNILLMIRHKFCGQEQQKVKRDEYLQAMDEQLNSQVRKNMLPLNQTTLVAAAGPLKQSLDSPTMSVLRQIRMDITRIKQKPINLNQIKEYQQI